jgi:tRNA U38,U39,U40 pseudouridine synthase TruA
MNEASKILMGTHDFRNFCCIDKSSGRLEMSYVRTIDSAYVEEFGR